MQVDEFLRTVVTTPEGFFCLAHRQESGWQEQFFQWPGELDKIVGEAQRLRESGDVYFSAHLFSEPRSLKANVLPTRTIQADLDYADTGAISVLPSILTETSPDRHQGFWITQTALNIADLEQVSRRIAYGVPDCDKTGWPAGKKVRLPHTYNYKYDTPHLVDVVGVSLRDLRLDMFNNFPELKVSKEQAEKDVDWVDNEQLPLPVDTLDLLTELKPLIPARVYSQYTKPAKDRSAALWAFTTEVLRAGCSREQAFWLARTNANNKFVDRPGADRDLRKDVLRAEQHIGNRQADVKSIIMDLRYKGNRHLAERLQLISQVVLNMMREQGEFVHCRGGGIYYLRRETGRPVYVTLHGEWLSSYLDTVFGLNGSEAVTKYVIHTMAAYCKTLPQSNDLQVLSFYDKFSKKLLIHTGGRDVLHVSADSITAQANGYGGIVFQWNPNLESIALEAPLDTPWHEFMYAGQLDNLINLTREEGLALLRVWTLFLLFRRMASTRPILALIGQPGSGKTTTAHKIYRLIYGPYKSVGDITNQDDFDLNTANLPLVAYDNLDTWVSWLPNRLAAGTSDTDIEKRKLYTDGDIITRKRQALLLLTAHNPRFTREDVVDRMVMLTFSRYERHGNENAILDSVTANRGRIWASIVQDVQSILATPMPTLGDCPQFRIEDFSYLGVWFARAHSVEMEASFRRAINKIAGNQRSFNLEQDQMLVDALVKMVTRHADDDFVDVETIHTRLLMYVKDAQVFKTTFKMPMHIGRKLWVMQNSLKEIFNIEWQYAANGVGKLWRIRTKETA